MSQTNTLFKNTIIYTIGNFGSKLLNFLLVPLFSFYLSKSELGYYDLTVVTTNLCIPFVTFQLSDSVYRWLLEITDVEAGKSEMSKIISNSMFIMLVNLVIGTIIFIIYILIFPVKDSFLLFLYISTQCIQPYFQQIARGLRNNKLYAVTGLLEAVILLVCNVFLLVFLKLKAEALFLAAVIANIATIIYLMYKIHFANYISIKDISKKFSLELIKYSIPLIPNVISWWMIGSANRYLIIHFLGEENNGIYALASRFPVILVIVNSIFTLSWQESAITEFNSENRDNFYSKVFNQFYILEMSSVIVLIALSKLMIQYTVSPKFFEAWKYLPLLYIAVAFSAFSAFLGTGYLSSKNTIGAFKTTIFGAVVNLAISYVLIPMIGLQGAVIGTLIGFFATWMARVYQTKKYFTINLDLKKIVPLTLTSFLFSLCLFFANGLLLNSLLVACALTLFFIINYKIIFTKLLPKLKDVVYLYKKQV